MAKKKDEVTTEEAVVTEEVAVAETEEVEQVEEVVADEAVTEEAVVTEEVAPSESAKKYIGGEQVAFGVRYVSTGRFRCPKCGNGYNADVNDVISGEAISCGCDK